MRKAKIWNRIMRQLTAAGLAAALMITGLIPVSAQTTEEEACAEDTFSDVEYEKETVTYTYVNPIYGESRKRAYLAPYQAEQFVTADTYYTTIDGAAARMRTELKKRQTVITVGYSSQLKVEDAKGLILDIASEAMKHTGVPTEGDYILFQFSEFSAKATYSFSGGKWEYNITYTIVYHTNATQEMAVDAEVKKTLASLNLASKSDYEKIRAIYDYICTHVTYDYSHMSDSSYKLQYTAYGALVNGTAICQGYAVLFYRLALEAGIDARETLIN